MNLTKNQKVGLYVFAIIVLFIGSIKFYSLKKAEDDIVVIKNEATNKKEIQVYICGEVKKPGVYKINDDKRIIDLVYLAGGFTDNANLEAVNLATKLKDEDYIKIPTKNKNEKDKGIIDSRDDADKININTASIEELKKLPRIGDALAKRIIEYRNKNGPFKRIEDLKNVSGIGDKMFENIKDLISIY
ncbi:helix-hairpin-helix domain-containing protein [Caloramator proteoclasticus]|uniref:Competence protein ComEA n=1 Tax=Caloramator proteoclasticus DSM 10124 TaxID=1121262 RepID=A0A1M4TK34_9CLOT|nr:helix-hairpin-helix domain-containing protein [Caloramator proteoclasticus]SHE44724.1 competence protein ComEA [Caloramator proteoclasticus DSM 10124]